MNMILITGATGKLGSAVVEFLLERVPAEKLGIMIRSEHKADDFNFRGIDVRTGDYNNKDSLLKAFKGIEKLLLVSGNDVEKREQQHVNAIDAAKEAGVKHLIYTSLDRRKDEGSRLGILAQAHINTERYLKESGLAWTILRNTLYAESLPMFFGDAVMETGIFFPAGEGKVPFVTRQELAEGTAVVLADSGHENREYMFANNNYYSMYDAAVLLSDITGREVKYHNPPREVYVEKLKDAGISQQWVDFGAAFGDAIKNGEFETGRTDLDRILGRKPASLKDFLKQVYTPV